MPDDLQKFAAIIQGLDDSTRNGGRLLLDEIFAAFNQACDQDNVAVARALLNTAYYYGQHYMGIQSGSAYEMDVFLDAHCRLIEISVSPDKDWTFDIVPDVRRWAA